jgi:hypothetical protein
MASSVYSDHGVVPKTKAASPKELSCNGWRGMGPVMSWKQRDHAVLLELERQTPKTRGIGDYKEKSIHCQTLDGL